LSAFYRTLQHWVLGNRIVL